ncbi:MAG TPA: hypothetical protein VGI40_04380 [Pirellulaceae bacterium]
MSKSIANSPPPPSPRDLEIYKRSVVFKHDQLAIAAHYDLGQPRISQIVNNVRDWLAAGGSPEDPAIRDHFAQQKLTRATQKIRLLRIIDMATYAMENRLQSQVKTKHRYQGTTEVWHEEVRHLAPEVNLPAMRLLLRAVKTLDDLETKADPTSPPKISAQLSPDELLHSVFEFLCQWRTRAEAAGHLSQSADIPQLIANGLRSLIGVNIAPTHPSHTHHSLSPTNTAANISAPPELLITPTTDQLSTSAN